MGTRVFKDMRQNLINSLGENVAPHGEVSQGQRDFVLFGNKGNIHWYRVAKAKVSPMRSEYIALQIVACCIDRQ